MPKTEQEPMTSFDAQVDQRLSDYERDAKKQNSGVEEALFRDWSVSYKRLCEAGESKGESNAADDIDVSSFVNEVLRMCENFDSVIEIKQTLLRRARMFLSKVYADEVLRLYDSTLREEHGIVVGANDDEAPGEEDRWVAAGAGPIQGGA